MEALGRALSDRGLTVSSLPGKGRGLVATSDFLPGDAIIHEDAYASCPSKLSSGSVCDACFASANLKKCSGCRMVQYCSIACQKSEWKIHQLECQALSTLSDDRKTRLTPTIRLVVRLVLRRKLQDDKVVPTTEIDNYDLVDALVSHMSALVEKQLVLYAQMANLVKVVLPFLEINLKEMTEIFSKLSCNAHTICDSELRPLGTGLYPVISIINHSCVPNSVLVFEGRKAFVRAVEPIRKGDEVVISYIETAATTKTRQNDLKQYFFTCSCLRCTKSPHEDLKEDAILDGFKCIENTCDGFLLQCAEKETFSCHQCGTDWDEYKIKRLTSELEEMHKKAAASLSAGNPFEASLLYRNVEQLEIKLFHRDSIKLLRTRETLLKSYMELNDWRGALRYCQLTIPVYERLYQSIHPILGLQHYTCGKLEWLLEETDDALKSFTKALDILRITHGTSSPFVKELISRVDEARAEAAYKHST